MTTQPIQPPAPVNTVITIQPVTVNAPQREGDSVPNPLTNLASGTTVEGFVVNRDAQNNPILRTPIGDLRVTSEVFLKTGSEVIFRVDTSQTSLARILTVDGMSPQEYSATNTRRITQDTIAPSTLQPSLVALTGQPVKPGVSSAPVLQALILQAQPAAAPSLLTAALSAAQSGQVSVLAQLAQLRAGTPIRLTLHDLKLPPLPVSIGTIPEAAGLERLLPQRPQNVGNNVSSAPAFPTAPAVANPETSPTRPLPQGQYTSPRTEAAAAQAAAPAVPTPRNAPVTTAAFQPTPPVIDAETAPIQAAIERLQVNALLRQFSEAADGLPLKSDQPAAPAQSAATQPNIQEKTAVPSQNIAVTNPVKTAPATEAPLTPTTPNQIVADVIGHDADGANILHTSVATLKLYTAQPLPTGTSLLVSAEIEPHAPQASPAPALADQKFISEATRDLTSLEDAFAWLTNNHPDIARDVQQRLPSVDHKLASGLLFFISALKGGEVMELFGKRAIRQLELAAPDLLARLRRDVGQMQTNIHDSPLDHWMTIPLPLLLGQEMHQARLYISKDSGHKSPDGKSDKGHRFVLEVGLSQLGQLQFDGFVRKLERNQAFDLIVRSDQPLEGDIQQGIRTIFENSLQVTGLHGQVIFQQGSQHFVKPLAEPRNISAGDSPNTILA